jgi:iron complex transport system substrate-binding protein
MSKRVVHVVLCLLVVSLLVISTVATSQQGIVVQDALGRSVNLSRPPQRVVVLAPSITEILADLGLLDVVVGADSYSLSSWYLNVGDRLKRQGIVDVGGYWWSVIRVEEVLKLTPDLVLADAGAHRPLLETFDAYNVTTIFLHGGSAKSVSDVLVDIYLVGQAFNKTEEARGLADRIIGALEEGRSRLAPYHGKKVLVVVGFWQGIWVAGRGTYIDDILARLGLRNAAQSIGWSLANIEVIASWSPDIIVVAAPDYTEEVAKQAGLYNLNRPVIPLNQTEIDIVSRPGPLVAMIPSVLERALQKAYGEAKIETPATQIPQERRLVVDLPTLALIVTIAAVTFFIAGYTLGLKRK